MKTLRIPLSILAASFAALSLSAQVTANPNLPEVVILPNDDPAADPQKPKRVIWSTEPGIRYELQESTTLAPASWTTVAGFPSIAEALAQQHAFEVEAGGKRFFRVSELDEQPPEVVRLSPKDGAFGVGRFRPMTIELADRTGIDPDSIALSIGGGAAITLSHPALSFEDDVLVYDLEGESALGGYGETISFSLIVADLFGNTASHDWSFELERQIVAVENLFVFGSPNALRAGQQLSGPAAAVAARFGGPVRMSDPPSQWSIHSVNAGSVVIAYTSAAAPSFSVGQKITNLAPAHVDHIFYREVTGVSVNSSAKTVTLQTTDLNLPDIMLEGSFTFGENAEILEFDEHGNLTAMREFTVQLQSVGTDLSGTTVYPRSPGDDLGIQVTLPEGRALFHPSVTISLETSWGNVERFSARAEGNFDIAVVPHLTFDNSYSNQFSKDLWNAGFWVWTSVGIIPVGVEVTASIKAKADLDVAAQASFTTGFRQTASMGVEGAYVRNASPSVSWNRWFHSDPLQQVPFTYTIDGQGNASVALVPQIDVRLYGASGLYVNIDPRLELSGSASMANGTITQGNWFLGVYADVNAGLSVIGFNNSQLPALPPFRFFTREWADSYPAGGNMPLAITRQPVSQTVWEGDAVVFAVQAIGTGTLRYQWYHNDTPLPNRTSRELRLTGISSGTAGEYRVRVTDQNGTLDSDTVMLDLTNDLTGGSSMVTVQGGTLAMSMGTQTVNTFQIGRHPVTWGEWQSVRAEAVARGYDIGNAGAGCGGNHPVQSINWYDAVKWCNLKSEIEGLAPVYYLMGFVFRTGELPPFGGSMNIQRDNTANGYRLPTEAEWEFAARGGNQTNGFTYSGGNNLNEVGWYRDNSLGAACDLSESRGTWPVGQKNANELGLFDMSGNVWEWCWDPVDWMYYSHRSRGGSWYHESSWAALNARGGFSPENRSSIFGLRLARTITP